MEYEKEKGTSSGNSKPTATPLPGKCEPITRKAISVRLLDQNDGKVADQNANDYKCINFSSKIYSFVKYLMVYDTNMRNRFEVSIISLIGIQYLHLVMMSI